MASMAWRSIALLMLMSATGCGFSGAGGTNVDSSAPDQVVANFLEAVRTGDDQRVTALLTPKARLKTAEADMVVAPPGSETAEFKLGELEVGEHEARVASYWTDLGSDGRPHTDLIVWILHHEAEGWRIAGMSAQAYPDSPVVELNFEDPREMAHKQRLAEEEMDRRQRAERNRVRAAAERGAPIVR